MFSACMAYDAKLADRVRESLAHLTKIEEKEMMGGLSFMYNGKMCVGIIKDEMMCRVDPEIHESLIEKKGCRTMDFTKKPMRGWIMIDESGMKSERALNYWIELAVAYNKQAKSSKSKKREKK